MTAEKPLRIIFAMEAGEPFELWVQPPGRSVRRIPLTGEAIIGRDEGSAIVLDSPFVSRSHARVEADAKGGHVVRDLDSRNGTWLNGRRIAGPSRLAVGDEISIAEFVIYYRHPAKPGETIDWDESFLSKSSNQVAVYVDPSTREVWVRGERVKEPLPRLEFELLAVLYQRSNEVVRLDDIGATVWGTDAYDRDMLHQLISRLKKRIEPDPAHPQFIINVRGVGYQLLRAPRQGSPVSQP